MRDIKRFIINIEKEEERYIVSNRYLERSHRSVEMCPEFNDYVEKADLIKMILDETQCVFSKELISHYETYVSDGEWIWSTDLIHYSKKHGFVWPQSFIDSLRNKEFKLERVKRENVIKGLELLKQINKEELILL